MINREKKHNGGLGERPLVWRSGPDPTRHAQWIAFGRARCQARFRGEPWSLTFTDYEDIWRDHWHLRGRGREDLCMGRCDYRKGWTVDNCELITRQQHNQRQAAYRMSRR